MNRPDSARRPGSGRPVDLQQPPFGESCLAERLLSAPGMLPVIEDPGHLPGDGQLGVLDPLGLQALAAGGGRIAEGDEGRRSGADRSLVRP